MKKRKLIYYFLRLISYLKQIVENIFKLFYTVEVNCFRLFGLTAIKASSFYGVISFIELLNLEQL